MAETVDLQHPVENALGVDRIPAGHSSRPVARPIPWQYRPMLRKIRAMEARLAAQTDAELRGVLERARRAVRDGGSLDKFLPAVFGAVCVAAQRHLSLRPYDVQLVAGYELHQGRIAEMATGEGKTLVAALPATLNAITGRGVHVVTVNDYLARRDAETIGPIYRALGLSVGVILTGLDDDQRRAAYRCDVVYGTNKEFGFDYLRDQIKLHAPAGGRASHRLDALALLKSAAAPLPVMRQLHYAVIDEADSILIDESRTPLIIAGAGGASTPSPLAWAYQWADDLAPRFRARHDFEFEPQRRKLEWKEEGLRRLQRVLEETDTPSVAGESWQNLVLNALRARHLFLRERNYVVVQDDVVIVDEFTGRRMPGRTWSEGIHQAIQAKEGLAINAPARTLARTTYQHFFSLYQKLAGMTGTAATERWEFRKIYKLSVRTIPTRLPVRRLRLPDRVYRTTGEKWHAVAGEIEATRTLNGRPILVGTSSIDDSETLSGVLTQRGIPHELLNARPENAAREAEIVAAAGRRGAVTIATNMAGRGTDIRLGPGVAEVGGLYVIGTQRHESRRVDNQLAGRCARQGDPGAVLFMLSLEDPLLQHLLTRKKLVRLRRRFARSKSWGSPIVQTLNSPRLRRLFARAQLKVESLHFRQRQQLMEYEDWLNQVYYQMGGG